MNGTPDPTCPRGMRRVRTPGVALLVITTLATGCVSSAYTPRHPRMLTMVQRDGMPAYQVAGRYYSASLLGDGLVAATAGVPAAQRFAQDSQSAAWRFLGLYIGGFAVMLGSTPFLVGGLVNEGDEGRTSRVVGGTMFAAGLVALGLSVVSAAEASARRFDAVNAFNDAVTLRPSAYPAAGAGPPAAIPVPRAARY